jgi:hypothetical protein
MTLCGLLILQKMKVEARVNNIKSDVNNKGIMAQKMIYVRNTCEDLRYIKELVRD